MDKYFRLTFYSECSNTGCLLCRESEYMYSHTVKQHIHVHVIQSAYHTLCNYMYLKLRNLIGSKHLVSRTQY